MANGKIEIDTSINTDGIDKGVKKIDTSLKTIAKGGATFAAVTSAVKLTTKAIKDTTEAYKVQAKAETQLEQAARNNPYLSRSSVQQLKNYASELQSISTIGDEQLLPFMAQLAASGRTQTEIQNIMKAALDVSASGMMSLDSAVSALNGTFNGNIGLLGRQIGELKGLTEEELKSGKAVDIIKNKFGGMAEEVAKATGSSEQLKNAFGDLKEEIGVSFEKNLSPMRRFFTELITGWTNAKKARREYNEAVESDNKTVNQWNILIKAEQVELAKYEAKLKRTQALLQMNDKELKNTTEYDEFLNTLEGSTSGNPLLDFKNKNIELEKEYAHSVDYSNVRLQNYNNSKKDAAEWEQKAIEDAQKKAEAEKAEAEEKARLLKLEEEQKNIEEERENFIKANQKDLETRLKQMEIEAELTGKKVEDQDKLNVLMDSYISLVTGSDLVDENNPFSKKRYEELVAFINGMEKLNETTTNWVKILDETNNYLNEAHSITKDANALFLGSLEDDTKEQIAELSEMYTKGLISYEEYCDKRKDITRKSAQEEYKLKMYEWTSSLLVATANVAQGVSKAIAENGYPQGAILGALAAAAGAVQIATITANKPKPPQFANGGYVGGNSTRGDKVHALVNSGELILNTREQAVISSLIGRGGKESGAVVNMPVTIENNTGANVSTELNAKGLTVIIDDIVNSSMASGKYNNSMDIARARSNGASYF